MRNIKQRIERKRVGTNQKKILLLLLGGLALSCSRSPNQTWQILGEIAREWKEINRQQLERAITSLYDSKLVGARRNPDNTFTIVLNDNGHKRALTYNLAAMKIKRPKVWDGLWRMVSFDIPETVREVRDSIRTHLLRLGFYELHQSMFVHPFECKDEIAYIVELYDAKAHVRFITAKDIDNSQHLKRFFNLS